jgi:hypothetical protein
MLLINAKVSSVTPEMHKALDGKNYYNGMVNGLQMTGGLLVNEARQGIINSPKTYKVYYINGRRTKSSQPYTYPANQTGRLRKSIRNTTNGLQMRFGASTSAPYAKYLQKTDGPFKKDPVWTRVAPRPVLTLAHRSVSPKFQSVMLTSVLRNIGK